MATRNGKDTATNLTDIVWCKCGRWSAPLNPEFGSKERSFGRGRLVPSTCTFQAGTRGYSTGSTGLSICFWIITYLFRSLYFFKFRISMDKIDDDDVRKNKLNISEYEKEKVN